MRLLGIDVGSSGVKAATFDLLGNQVETVRVPCSSIGEFDPRHWLAAVNEALTALDLRDVAAAGVCGRGGTNVLLGADGDPVAPSWDDAREANEVRALRASALSGGIPQALGLLARARWWEHERGPVAAAVSAKDYVVFALTGCLQSDPAAGGWSPAPAPHPLVEARQPWSLAGRTRGGVSPLTAGVPVAVGWHDGAAATFGAGAAVEGTAPVTIATNAVYRVVLAEIPSPLRKYWDLTPGLVVTGGDILHSGLAWQRASRSFFPTARAEEAPPGCHGVTFLPQLSGRIAPGVNRAANAGWLGVTAEATANDLLRAVAEGTACSLRQVRDWLRGHDLEANRTIATGGGAHSPLQAQMVADLLEEPLEVCPFEEGCRGAALLGAVAAGHLTLDDARTLPNCAGIIEPDPSLAGVYAETYERFLRRQSLLDRDRHG